MNDSSVTVTETAHKINNMNHSIMLNTPVIKAAWNDVISMLKEYSEELEGFTIAGMAFEQACSIIPELITGIEKSSLQIKSSVGNLKNKSLINDQIK